MIDFSGLSAFPITPADTRGVVDTEELRGLIARLKNAKVDTIGLLGSTGTFAYLARHERRRAIDAAASELSGTIPLIVGVGALRTDEACELARDAREAGADALLLAPVSYTPLTQDEAFHHYAAVASASDLPLCVYNNPSTTHFQFSQSLIERLARVPHINAIKLPLPADGEIAGDLSRLRAVLPPEFSIGYSGDWGCAEALLAGADTWYSVIAGLFPEIAMRLRRAAQAGDSDETRRIDAVLVPFWRLFKDNGSLRVVYAAAKLMGLTRRDAPRPILPLGTNETRSVAAALEQLQALSS